MSKELIIKAQKGDAVALNELIDNHKDIAFSIALKYLKNEEDAKDIVQNAFIIVLQSIKKFRNEAKFSTWLFRIVYNECLKEIKRKNKTVEYSTQLPEKIVEEYTEEKVDIKAILAVLKPREYTVVTLFYLENKSINEISKITALRKSNIKVLLHRARNKMKKSLKNERKNY